jgi:hypothetical protein
MTHKQIENADESRSTAIMVEVASEKTKTAGATGARPLCLALLSRTGIQVKPLIPDILIK